MTWRPPRTRSGWTGMGGPHSKPPAASRHIFRPDLRHSGPAADGTHRAVRRVVGGPFHSGGWSRELARKAGRGEFTPRGPGPGHRLTAQGTGPQITPLVNSTRRRDRMRRFEMRMGEIPDGSYIELEA